MNAAWIVTGALVVVLGGCSTANHGPGYSSGNGALIDSLDKAGVGCPTSKSAKLTLAGDQIAVDVGCTNKDGTVDVKLTAYDAVFEREQYRQTSDTFELVNAAGEVFDPPVLLVKVPLHIGDRWTWNGTMKSGQVGHPAKATISTSQERLFPPSGVVDALKVQVDFEIDGGASNPSKRSLSFWMASGQGVLKRQFGSSSIREPAGP